MLVLRWFLDATRVAQLARDNQISSSTAYRYLHEGIDVLAAAAPRSARQPARRAFRGALPRQPRRHLIRTDRSKAAGPTARVDLWWSGKHHHHGGIVQVVTAPDGWPLWTSPVRPGREHDVTCARTHPGLLDALTDWTSSSTWRWPIWATSARTPVRAAGRAQLRGGARVALPEERRRDLGYRPRPADVLMPADEELREQQQRAAYVEALRHEHAGYVQYGRTDRAETVAAELARLGATTGGSSKPKGKEPTSRRRTTPPAAATDRVGG